MTFYQEHAGISTVQVPEVNLISGTLYSVVVTNIGSGAVEYLTVISVLFCINGLLMVFRNTLQGLGYSVQAVISGVGELIGRALCGWLAVHSLGYFGICIANPIAWGLALLYCVFMVTRVLKKENA